MIALCFTTVHWIENYFELTEVSNAETYSFELNSCIFYCQILEYNYHESNVNGGWISPEFNLIATASEKIQLVLFLKVRMQQVAV